MVLGPEMCVINRWAGAFSEGVGVGLCGSWWTSHSFLMLRKDSVTRLTVVFSLNMSSQGFFLGTTKYGSLQFNIL